MLFCFWPISRTEDFLNFFKDVSPTHDFFPSDLKLIFLESVERLFATSQSPYPAEPFINAEPIPRVSSAEYLGITIDESLTWSSHLFSYIKRGRRQSFQKTKRGISRPGKTPSHFTFTSVCPHLFYCSSTIFLISRRTITDVFVEICQLSAAHLPYH